VAGCTEPGSSDAQALARLKYTCTLIRAGIGDDGERHIMFTL
jgi:hypothetical protein